MAKSLKKKIILYFHITKKISKICISMHFGFNNQFIKVARTRPIFQKFQKIILFSYNIWGYDLIRKTHFDTIKELISYPKCRSVKVINNPTRPGSNHRKVNYINYK